MADKNLTSAIFEIKDRGPSKYSGYPKQSDDPKPARSNIRRRSFDAFYFFATVLLALSTFAQIGALIAYR